MGNPQHSHRGRGPLGVGTTHALDGHQRSTVVKSEKTGDATVQGAPETTSYLRVYFGRVNNTPAVFEYEPQSHWFWGLQIEKPYLRKRQLTFKTRAPRSQYQVGDLILHDSIEERDLIKKYPALAPSSNEEQSPIIDILSGLVLGWPEKLNIAYEIKNIIPGSNGKGRIELAPILMLDEKTFIELEPRISRTQSQLSEWWTINISMTALLRVLEPATMFFYEASLAALTGGVASLARSGTRGAILFTLRQASRTAATRLIARKFVVTLAKNSTKATLAGTKAFATTFAKTYQSEARAQQLADAADKNKQIDRRAFDVALTKSAGAFAATFMTTLLDIGLEKMLKASGYSEIQQALTKRITDAFATNIPATFTNAIAEAWAKEQVHPGTFADSLGKALIGGLGSNMSNLVKVDFKNIGEALAN